MKLRITVHGVAYEVEVEILDAGEGLPQLERPAATSTMPQAPAAPQIQRPGPARQTSQSGAATSPIAGTVISINCKVGDQVKRGQELIVIEAMKMETTVASPTDGKIKAVAVAAGDSVREGATLVEFE